MIYIEKGKEPSSLTRYKKEKDAYFDGFKYKDEIRLSLLKEQGYLCAYCMKRINGISEMTIEHYDPQSESDTSKALDYRNMLGVCKGGRGLEKKYQTCDAHRGNVKLTVNPLDRSSVEKIKYKQKTGEICSDDPAVEQDLNITLNLNCKESMLPENRKSALESLKRFLIGQKENGTWSRKFLNLVKSEYQSKDNDGKYEEYAGIILWYINKRLEKAK